MDVTALDVYGNPGANGWTSVSKCVLFSGPLNSPNSTAPIYPGVGSCSGSQSELSFDSSGKATASGIKLFNAASTTLTVADAAQTHTGSVGPFTVNPAPLNNFTLTNLSPAAPETANAPFSVDVTALDAYGNAASGWITTNGCVVFSGPSNSPNNTPPIYPGVGSCSGSQSELSFDSSGKATASGIKLFNAASTTLTVADAAQTHTGSVGPFTVNPAPLNNFTLTNLSPAAPETAGSAFSADVTALDAYGNAASGWITTNGCVVFSGPSNSPNNTPPIYPAAASCNGSPSGQSRLSFDSSGKATASGIKLFNAASTTLMVADAATQTHTGSATFTVQPAALDHFTVTNLSPAAPETANTPFSADVTALDVYGNPGANGWASASKCVVFSGPLSSPNSTGPIYPGLGSCTGSPSGQSQLSFDSAGKATASGIKLFNAASTTLTVKDAATQTHTGSTTFTVKPDELHSAPTFTQQPTLTQVGINFSPAIQVAVKDPYGNPINGTTVAMTLIAGVNLGTPRPRAPRR